MSEHTHPADDGMRVCPDRQTLEEFIPWLRLHIWAILDSRETLKPLKSAFDSGQRIWPAACSQAIQSLSIVSEQNKKFHASIEHSMHLPLVVVPLRLSLLVTLKNIDTQISKLTQLFNTLFDKSKTVVSQSADERYTIVRELDVLIQHCEQAVQQAEELLRIAQEQEYSLVSSTS